MASIRISLFGTFTLEVDGKPIALRLQSARKLLALLALKPGESILRTEITERLWPGEEYAVAGNRLRTALVEARAALQPYSPIGGDAKAIELDSVDSDVNDVKALLRKLRIATEEAEEEQILLRLRELLREPLLPEFSDDWVEAERFGYRMRKIDTLLRLSLIASQRKEFEKAAAYAEEAVAAEPFHEKAWMLLLRSLAKAGRASEAALRFREAKRKLTEEVGGKFSRELMDLAKAVRDGEITIERVARSLTVEEGELINRTFAALMEASPDEALTFLGSSAFTAQSANFSIVALELLESALAATEGASEPRIKTTLNTLHLHYLRGQSVEALKYGEWLLENDPDPLRRAATMHMLALVHFNARDFDKAYQSIDDAEKIFIEHRIEHRVLTARAQRVTFDFYQGHLDRVIAEFKELLERLQKNPLSGKSALTAIPMNIGVAYIYKGEFGQADAWLAQSRSVILANDYRPMETGLEAAQGYVKVMQGLVREGTAMLLDALVRALRLKELQPFYIALDYTASVLASAGHASKAVALMDKCGAFRAESRYLRAAVEEDFVSKIRTLAGDAKPDPDWANLTGPREVLTALVETLGVE